MIRIYGHKLGEGSITQVTRGLLAAAEAEGVLAGFVPVDAMGEDDFPGATAPAALTYLSPKAGPSVALPLRIGQHQERWLMLAPNSDRIPEQLVKWLPDYVTGLVAPSEWAARVLRAFFERVIVCPHGINEAFFPDPQLAEERHSLFRRGLFGVLHMTSTSSERKGTRELLDGWKLALERHWVAKHGALFIIAPHEALAEHRFWVNERKFGNGEVYVMPEFGLSPAGLAKRIGRCHLVIQPSRGEGFGLVPLESRALGVPTAATCITGHTQHFPKTAGEALRKGCILIPHGPDKPIDDLPGAAAPSLDREAIAEAIRTGYQKWPELSADALLEAPAIVANWSWQRQAGPVLKMLAHAAK